MKPFTLMIATLALVTSTTAVAGSINLRQLNQERLIDAGERSGKLTRSEANVLNAEQRSIERLHDRLKARHGGHLTKRDNATIRARQMQAGRHIAQQKRDRQRGRNHLKL